MFLNADAAHASVDDLVRVTCARAGTTRIVLPGSLMQISGEGRAQRALGVTVERTRPYGVLRVDPRGHAGAALVDLRGPGWHLRLALQTVEGARARTLHLGHAPAPTSSAPALGAEAVPHGGVPSSAAATPAPQPTSTPPALVVEPSAAPPPPADPSPAPTQPPSPAATPDTSVAFDVRALLRAQRVRLGRQEGLPGQRRMTLVEALHDETLVWLRFTLGDGAAERVQSVAWERGPLASFTQEPVGAHLHVVVQLPRAAVTRRTRVTLAMASGAEYRFALNSGTLADVFRSPF